MKRTIVIGDLHGCCDEAIELLSAVQATSSDRVIFAGDLIDRGPQPRECVELAMKHECVLGNHEEKHVKQWHLPLSSLIPDHAATRAALDDSHAEYFRSLPRVIRLPEYNAAVVHAGAFPGVPLEQQTDRHLMHIQHIKPPNTQTLWPSKAPADYSFWTNHWRGPERIIFGHTVLDRPLVSPWAVGIDTGAVFGRGLTALVLPEWKLVTVRSRNFGSRIELATYEIQDGVRAFS